MIKYVGTTQRRDTPGDGGFILYVGCVRRIAALGICRQTIAEAIDMSIATVYNCGIHDGVFEPTIQRSTRSSSWPGAGSPTTAAGA